MTTTYFLSTQACCGTFLVLSVYQKRIGCSNGAATVGCQACISKQCKALTVMHCNGPVLESGQSAARGAKQQRAVNISGQSAASCTLVWLKWAWWWGAPERKGGISVASKSSCNQLCVQAQPCMFSAPFWKGLGNRMLQLTPSVAHLVLHYLQAIKVPCSSSSGDGKELMIPFVLSQGTEPKQMTTTNPSNLAAVSTSALFFSPPEAWNAHIARRAPPGSRRPRDSLPLSGQGELDKWLEQTSLSPARDDSHHCHRHHCKLHHPNSIILFMPAIVDTAPCDWRHALHRLIGILNWKTAGEKHKYRHPEDCHATAADKGVNFNLSTRHEVLTMLKSSSDSWKCFHLHAAASC